MHVQENTIFISLKGTDLYFLEGDGIQVLQCPLCKSGFKKQATLTEHIARKHATNKPFKVLYSK